jgi:hypothetical protein
MTKREGHTFEHVSHFSQSFILSTRENLNASLKIADLGGTIRDKRVKKRAGEPSVAS